MTANYSVGPEKLLFISDNTGANIPMCSAFQAGHAGSIPVTRSTQIIAKASLNTSF
jgi:hypothetical protein